MEVENRSLRKLLTGGDKLRIFKNNNFELYNNYGPTENSVVTTSYPVKQLLQQAWRRNRALDRWLDYLLRQGHWRCFARL